MKLLLDENLSRRLVPALQARFPGSSQVALLGLEGATDAQICEHAARQDFVVCSKDDDFRRLVAARGYRPRRCWRHCWPLPTGCTWPSTTRPRAWR